MADRIAQDGGDALGMVEVDVGDVAVLNDADEPDGAAMTVGVGVEQSLDVVVGALGGEVFDDEGGVGVAADLVGGGGRALAAGLCVLAVASVVGGGSTVSSTAVRGGLVVLATTLLLALLGGGGVPRRGGWDGRRSTGLDAAGPGFGHLGSRDGGDGSLGGGLESLLGGFIPGVGIGGRGGAGIAAGATVAATFLLVDRLGGRLGGRRVGRGVLSRSGGRSSLGVGGTTVGWYLLGGLRSRGRSLSFLGNLSLGLGLGITGSSSLGRLLLADGSRGRPLLGLHDAQDVVVDVVLLLPAGGGGGRAGQDEGVDEGPVGDAGSVRAGEVHVAARHEEDGAVDGVLGVDARLGGAKVDGQDVGGLALLVGILGLVRRGLDGGSPGEGVVGEVGEEMRLVVAPLGGGAAAGADVQDGRIGVVEVANVDRVGRQDLVVLPDEGLADRECVGGAVWRWRLRWRRGDAHGTLAGRYVFMKEGGDIKKTRS